MQRACAQNPRERLTFILQGQQESSEWVHCGYCTCLLTSPGPWGLFPSPCVGHFSEQIFNKYSARYFSSKDGFTQELQRIAGLNLQP